MDDGLKPRHAAVEILAGTLDRHQSLDVALQALDRFGLSGKDRAFARMLAMSALRRIHLLDALISPCLNNPIPPAQHAVMHVLRLGVVQLLVLQTPPHAAVHSSVELTRATGHAKAAGLVNAVLNRLIKEADAMLTALDEEAMQLPQWLWQRLCTAYGEESVRAIVRAQLKVPPLDLYVPEAIDHWAVQLDAQPLYGLTVRRDNADVELLPGYAEGAWWVQDLAASLPVFMLGDVRDKQVLDACAAPGGKTAQLARAGAKVVALDRSKARMKRLRENMARLRCTVQLVTADVMQWQTNEPFDVVVLDAPCTATGTMRRHPDLMYHKHESDIAEMAAIQRAMLERAAEWVRHGGTLLYCVCSLQPEEGEAQIAAFLKTHPHYTLDDRPVMGIPPEWMSGGMLRTLPGMLPDRGGLDGFFAARLIRHDGRLQRGDQPAS